MASLDLEDDDDHGELLVVVEDDGEEESHHETSSSGGKHIPKIKGANIKKKRDANALRKAPQAPKRFKSSYICFFMAKQPEIKDELGDKATVTEISKRSAQMWRSLPAEARAHWDDVAAKDKQRYMVEKASYNGPWQVPWKRAKKDPSAPKRPMSAFLYFSQGKRRQIKDANPSLKNTEVSRLLGEMWRNAPEQERTPHIEKEKEEREKYKVAIADWRREYDSRIEKERKAQAEQAAYMATVYRDPAADPQQQSYPPYGDPNMMSQYPGQPPPSMAPQPPAASSYGYGAPMYPYSYPVPQYQYPPANGKQPVPVILGPSGTPRYPPPAMNYGSGLPPHHMQQQQPPPSNPHHQYGGPLPPPPQGYDMNQGHQPSHHHYDYPHDQGMDHQHQQPPPPPPHHHQQQQQHHQHHQQQQQQHHHHHQE